MATAEVTIDNAQIMDRLKAQDAEIARLRRDTEQTRLQQENQDVLILKPLDIEIPKADIMEFLVPENKRPTTEWYWVCDYKGAHINFNIAHDFIEFQARGQEKQIEKVDFKFGIPHHGIGTDIKNAAGFQRYWILRGDLTEVEGVLITAEDITTKNYEYDGKKFQLRLPVGTKPKPDGFYPLIELVQTFHRLIEHRDSPRTKTSKKEGYRNLMTGEEYRLWIAAKYAEKWKIEEMRRVSKGVADRLPNEVKTGQGLKELMELAEIGA